jgi:ABC-type nitrate/sulfonate/bicarbonate transport system ATPase subunit
VTSGTITGSSEKSAGPARLPPSTECACWSALQQILKELKLAIKDGKLIALSGIVGTGKTTILQKIQELLFTAAP